jgi:hypothetical protein
LPEFFGKNPERVGNDISLAIFDKRIGDAV